MVRLTTDDLENFIAGAVEMGAASDLLDRLKLATGFMAAVAIVDPEAPPAGTLAERFSLATEAAADALFDLGFMTRFEHEALGRAFEDLHAEVLDR